MTSIRSVLVSAAAAFLTLATSRAYAAPIASSGYTLSTFALSPAGTSKADSVTIAGGNVYIGYGNGGDPTGVGATSTIAEYSVSGQSLATTTLVGHNDGLRYDAATNRLWAIQNEDANPNVEFLTPGTLAAQSGEIPISPTPHGGGYDDVAFLNGKAYISASNPSASPNTAPAIQQATIGSSAVTASPILAGNAVATDTATGQPTTLNLQDPDGIQTTPDGKLLLTSQGDSQLITVSNPGSASQSVTVQNVAAQVDDTAFALAGQFLLVADSSNNALYKVTGNFVPGQIYSAYIDVNNVGGVGSVNADGTFNTVATGFGNPSGVGFASASAVPEPGSLAVLGSGLLGVVGMVRRRRG